MTRIGRQSWERDNPDPTGLTPPPPPPPPPGSPGPLRVTVQRTVLVAEEVAVPLRMTPAEAREHARQLVAAADAVERTEPRWGGIPPSAPAAAHTAAHEAGAGI